jgi:acetyltransferase-like isoleucine patch superfamily enzyme
MKNFWFQFYKIYKRVRLFESGLFIRIFKHRLGYCADNVTLSGPIFECAKPENIFLYENTNIYGPCTFLIVSAKFIMKKNSGAAQGLTVVTGNHHSISGYWFKDIIHKEDIERDVIVEEDVWIAANVTLLAGVVVGRGSIIGAGSVCRKSIPPYAIVAGNPAKITGFRFVPEEIIEHEKILYPEKERLSFDFLNKNYEKYFLKRIDEIKDYIK